MVNGLAALPIGPRPNFHPQHPVPIVHRRQLRSLGRVVPVVQSAQKPYRGSVFVFDVDDLIAALCNSLRFCKNFAVRAVLSASGGGAGLLVGTLPAAHKAVEAYHEINVELPERRRVIADTTRPVPSWVTRASTHKNRAAQLAQLGHQAREARTQLAANCLATFGTGAMSLSLIAGYDCLGALLPSLGAWALPMAFFGAAATMCFGALKAGSAMRSMVAPARLLWQLGYVQRNDPLFVAKQALQTQCKQKLGGYVLAAASSLGLAAGVGIAAFALSPWGLALILPGCLGMMVSDMLEEASQSDTVGHQSWLDIGSKRHLAAEAVWQRDLGALAAGVKQCHPYEDAGARLARFWRDYSAQRRRACDRLRNITRSRLKLFRPANRERATRLHQESDRLAVRPLHGPQLLCAILSEFDVFAEFLDRATSEPALWRQLSADNMKSVDLVHLHEALTHAPAVVWLQACQCVRRILRGQVAARANSLSQGALMLLGERLQGSQASWSGATVGTL